VKLRNHFKWFEDWVLGRQTYNRLVAESGLSKRTLQNLFYTFLDSSPPIPIKPKDDVHLLIDGTYFSNNLCLVLYYDNDIKFTQLYRLTDHERYEQIKEDLENLKVLGVQLASITCDGHRSILKAIQKVYPQVRLQRCQFHVVRMALIWLRNKPKGIASQQLKEIVLLVPKVSSKEERQYCLRLLLHWYKEHKEYANEKTINPDTGRWWYTHRLLRRSYHSIKRAWPYMFHHLDDARVPKTTNALEGYFSHLKNHLSVHRGLSQKHRSQFIRWYLHLKNKEK